MANKRIDGFTNKNFVNKGLIDGTIKNGEGIKSYIENINKISPEKSELISILSSAENRSKKGKNPIKTGELDGISYTNPKKYLDAAEKKYTEIERGKLPEEKYKEVVKEDFDIFLNLFNVDIEKVLDRCDDKGSLKNGVIFRPANLVSDILKEADILKEIAIEENNKQALIEIQNKVLELKEKLPKAFEIANKILLERIKNEPTNGKLVSYKDAATRSIDKLNSYVV